MVQRTSSEERPHIKQQQKDLEKCSIEDFQKATRETLQHGEDWLYKMTNSFVRTEYLKFEGELYPLKAICKRAIQIYRERDKTSQRSNTKFFAKTNELKSSLKKTPFFTVDDFITVPIEVAKKRKVQPTIDEIDMFWRKVPPPRRGQGKFRTLLLDAYNRKCCITGSTIDRVIQAAHLDPYDRTQDIDAGNGLLMRADMHLLFDSGLLSINAETHTVFVHYDVASEYSINDNQPLKYEIVISELGKRGLIERWKNRRR